MIPDWAKTVKDALRGPDPGALVFDATLEVDDDYEPVPGKPVLLVADDPGPATLPGSWLVGSSPRRPTLRLTAYAAGRTEAHQTVCDGAEFVRVHRPGIARIEDIPAPLITRDRKTGAWLASIAVPVTVRQSA